MFVFTGAGPGEGLGPGRRGGDQNADGVPDIVACSYNSSIGAPGAGQLSVFSGIDGSLLRTITSAREGENLGFDAVSLGDVNFDGQDDVLVSGASLNVAYVIAGNVADSGDTQGSTGETTGDTDASTTDTTGASSSESGAETTGTGPDTSDAGESPSEGSSTVTPPGSETNNPGNTDETGKGGCGCQQAELGDTLPSLLVFGLFFGLLLFPTTTRPRF